MLVLREHTLNCGFQGNSDIYGLGIRIGIYIQTFNAWISSEFIRDNPAEINTVTNLFMTAVLVSLISSSFRHQLYAVEAFIMLQMLLIAWLTGPGERFRSSLMSRSRWIEGQTLTGIIKLLIVVYNALFWWRELDKLDPTPCGTFVFVLVYKFNLFGPLRTAYKVLSIVSVAVELRRATIALLGFVTAFRSRKLCSDDVHGDICKEALNDVTRMKSIVQVSSPLASVALPGPGVVPAQTTSISTSKTPTTTTKSCAIPGKSLRSVFGPSSPNGSVLPQLLEADKFIEHVFCTGMASRNNLTRRHVTFYNTNVRRISTAGMARLYWTSTVLIVKLIWTQPSRLQSLVVVLLAYGIEPEEQRSRDAIFIVPPMLQHPDFLRMHWKCLHLAAQLRLSAKARSRLPLRIWWNALCGFVLCSMQVVAVELTLVWNHITNVQDILSFGQLIPLIISCGGFVNLLYCEAKRILDGGKPFSNAGKESELEECEWVTAYKEWKDHYEKHVPPP